jgi:hypothetical protein
MKKINRVILKYHNQGLLNGSMTATETMVFESSGLVRHFKQNFNDQIKYLENYQVEPEKIINIFMYLNKHCLIEYMDDDYSVLLCDGFLWEIKCEYEDHTYKKIIWNTEVPGALDFVGFMIENLTDFNEKPLII